MSVNLKWWTGSSTDIYGKAAVVKHPKPLQPEKPFYIRFYLNTYIDYSWKYLGPYTTAAEAQIVADELNKVLPSSLLLKEFISND